MILNAPEVVVTKPSPLTRVGPCARLSSKEPAEGCEMCPRIATQAQSQWFEDTIFEDISDMHMHPEAVNEMINHITISGWNHRLWSSRMCLPQVTNQVRGT